MGYSIIYSRNITMVHFCISIRDIYFNIIMKL